MERVEAILYRKISKADFDNIEQRKKPKTGGGQRYIDAAGIKPDKIAEFFKYAKQYQKPKAPVGDSRLSYEINAYALGTNDQQTIEFAPRNDRQNHNITNQTLKEKNRHIAWRPEKGFPTAPRSIPDTVAYSMIANLVVFIIRTSHKKFYAGFINEPTLPESWPTEVGLERLLASNWNAHAKDNGVIFFGVNIAFMNDISIPFKLVSTIKNIDADKLPDEICNSAEDAVEFLDKEVGFNIDFANLSLQETPAPHSVSTTSSKESHKYKGIKRDYIQAQKNRKKIGDTGESIVYESEKKRLEMLGRPDLADEVEWTSVKKGDGYGYDIHSFDISSGKEKDLFIEVKTTTGDKTKPFDVSDKEIKFSKENHDSFVIFRIYGLEDKVSSFQYYKLSGSIKESCILTSTSYSATPK